MRQLSHPMRHIVFWIAVMACLVCLLCIASACVQRTERPSVTSLPALGEAEQSAAPTLAYDGHFPVGYPTVVPVIYVMNDTENSDWATLHPEYGPLGGWAFWPWSRIHVGPGQFDWSPIEKYLERSANYRITLRDGTVIPKPIALTIHVFAEPGADNTPEWVYQRIPGSPTLNGRLVGQIIDPDGDGPCPPLAAPAWGDPTWRNYFDEMVLALGRKFDNDPRINNIWIGTGLYGETVIEKDPYPGCGTYRFGVGSFGQWVKDRVLSKYREAFPTKPLYIINTGGGCLRLDTTKIATEFPVRIGLKHNSLAYDLSGEYDVLGCGKMETINPYTFSTPIAFEHAFAANPWQVYWSTMNGLAHHADLFDFHYEPSAFHILDVLTSLKDLLHGYDQWEFIDRYLGRSLNNSPGVWIIFRDTQWPRNYGLRQGGQCLPFQRWGWGEEGRDWGFWMYRKDVPGGQAPALVQIPGQRSEDECEPEYPNIYSRYFELPVALRASSSDYPWLNPDRTIKPEIIDKLYGYYAARRTNEPSDPYIFLDVDNGWAYWRNLPRSEPEGTTVYTVTVIYLDKGNDTWRFTYTDYYGRQKDKLVRKKNSLKWQVQTWRLSDMYLSDALTYTVDICLNSNGDGNDYFHMILLEAEGKAMPAPAPAPTVPPNLPEARVDELQGRAESIQERLQRILGIFQEFAGF